MIRDEDGKSKVQLDYDTWKKIREFVTLADKKNKETNVGQASGRDKGWNKGPGVN